MAGENLQEQQPPLNSDNKKEDSSTHDQLLIIQPQRPQRQQEAITTRDSASPLSSQNTNAITRYSAENPTDGQNFSDTETASAALSASSLEDHSSTRAGTVSALNHQEASLTTSTNTATANNNNSTTADTNVELVAHSSCSATARVETDETLLVAASVNGQEAFIRNQTDNNTSSTINNDQETMAIVSENMASIAITPAPLVVVEQRRQQAAIASVMDESSGRGMNSATTGIAKLLIVPYMDASSNPTATATTANITTVIAATEGGTKSGKKKRTPPPAQPGQTSGRWTHAEHEAFMEGLKIFGREWKKVAVRIPTRTSAQVRSHAQKYFSKQARDEQLMDQESSTNSPQSQAFDAASAPAADTAAEPAVTSEMYPPSVQRNVERILADPIQAQRDVEDTLQALRARYHHLQQRLREHHATNRQGSPSNVVAEDDKEASSDHVNMDQSERHLPLSQSHLPMQHQRCKRRRADQNGDDCSMASSTLSSLGNEELIALSVLGATLPNLGSPQHPPPPAAAADDANQHHAQQQPRPSALDSSSSSSSSTSSTASTNSAIKRKHDEAA